MNEKSHFSKWVNFDYESTALGRLLKKYCLMLSEISSGIRSFYPSYHLSLVVATKSTTTFLFELVVGRFARRIDLKQNGLKGVYPYSLIIGVSYKSICIPANEGWKWCILIGRYPDHSHSINKGFERKPVSQRHNRFFAKCNVYVCKSTVLNGFSIF